ncbi:MAG: hypothetical protein V1857_06855 [archaeon]
MSDNYVQDNTSSEPFSARRAKPHTYPDSYPVKAGYASVSQFVPVEPNEPVDTDATLTTATRPAKPDTRRFKEEPIQ